MRKKILSIVITAILLLPLFSSVTVVAQPSDEDILASIDSGLAWLAGQQNIDGSWGGSYKEARTSFALIKLQDYAWEHGISPFDESYEYYDNVTNGWNYIFRGAWPGAHAQTIAPQDHTSGATGTVDDPDENGNGIGISVGSGSIEVYSTGVMLMALEASRDPTRLSGIDFDGDLAIDSFFDVAQDVADWLAFVQGDSGNDEGGWGYDLHINATTNLWTDNSVSGYAALGIAAAEAFGCVVPQWVKTELNVWITTIQDPVDGDTNDGGSYYNPDWLPLNPWVNELKAGNLMFQMTLYGDDPSTQRFKDVLNYTATHWQDTNVDPGWGYGLTKAGYQSMFCLMKGFEYSGIDLIDLDGDTVPEHDWYEEFATVLLDQQQPDGHWNYSDHGDDMLATVWALLTLEKISPPPPIVTVSVDIKPGSWPNPFNKEAKGKFAVAICGTEDFDVSTIDPASIRITAEDDHGDLLAGAAPLRWVIEDVATPFDQTNPDEPDGHAVDGDGIPDLVLHFDRQEVVSACDLCRYGDKVYTKLYITGNLSEEDGSTPLEGLDWIRIEIPTKKGKK